MQPDVKNKLAGRTVFSLYCVGVAVCLETQLIVMTEHGTKFTRVSSEAFRS